MLMDLIRALKAGKELANPATWKNAQNATNALMVIFAFITTFIKVKFPDFIGLSDEMLFAVAGIIVSVVAAINGYITTASTKKIGSK